MHPTQNGKRMSQGLDGVRKVARERKQERFTALLHHFDHTVVLQSENTSYESITLSGKQKWKIVAKVLWWIGKAP
jgi:hypothetical protein